MKFDPFRWRKQVRDAWSKVAVGAPKLTFDWSSLQLRGRVRGVEVGVSVRRNSQNKPEFFTVFSASFLLAMPRDLNIADEGALGILYKSFGLEHIESGHSNLDTFAITRGDESDMREFLAKPNMVQLLGRFIRRTERQEISTRGVVHNVADIQFEAAAIDAGINTVVDAVNDIEDALAWKPADEKTGRAPAPRSTEGIPAPACPVEETPPASHESSSLVAQLRSGGAAHSVGTFTVDRDTAWRRLTDARFEKPERFVLELVAAANLLDMSEVHVTLGRTLCFVGNGECFEPHELQELYRYAFAGGDKRSAALSALAHAVARCCDLKPAWIKIRSGEVALEIRPGLEDQLTTGPSVPGFRVEVRGPFWSRPFGPRSNIARTLRAGARWARMGIVIQGSRMAPTESRTTAAGWVLLEEETIRARAFIDESGVGAIVIVKDGVVLDTLNPAETRPGLWVVLESEHFRRDASRTNVVRDRFFDQALTWVDVVERAVLTELAKSDPLPTWARAYARARAREVSSRSEISGPQSALAALPAWPSIDGGWITLAELGKQDQISHADIFGHDPSVLFVDWRTPSADRKTLARLFGHRLHAKNRRLRPK